MSSRKGVRAEIRALARALQPFHHPLVGDLTLDDALELPAAPPTPTPEQGAPVPIQPKQPTAKGPANWFTGDVSSTPSPGARNPSRVRVSAVRFTPSARTAWHAHALGQTLYVTEGKGLVQSRGGPVEEIRPGDVISTPPTPGTGTVPPPTTS